MPKSITFDREQVISDVMKLFWEKGYNGTSMQDLVDVTGLNRSSFYNTFGDKFSLFQESIRHYQAEQQAFLNRLMEDSDSPKAIIRALFENIKKEGTLQEQNKGCFMSNCTTELSNQDQRVCQLLVDNKDQMIARFTKLIQNGQKIGEIDPQKDAKTLALFLFTSLNGLQVTSMIDTDIDEVIEQILSNV